MNNTLVSNFARLRNWKPKITNLREKLIAQIKKLQKLVSNSPP